MLDNGWTFNKTFENASSDRLFQSKFLYEIYQKSDPLVNTRVTVPIFWDKLEGTIVNNESSEIIRMFNTSFNQLTKNFDDFYPAHLKSDIDTMNDFIYKNINNGVYKVGFATNQTAYEAAAFDLFRALDSLEKKLQNQQYLIGDILTEADIRLIPTLLRFDCVYYTHFKCNFKRIREYPALFKYTKALYEMPEIKSTTNFNHIKRHYYFSHDMINPYRIVPIGPKDIF